MTKYLDSKGLSYLWQKIKAELALKSDNHEHPYVKDDTVIKLGSTDTTGISLVKGIEGVKDSWTLPFATSDKIGVVRTGKADFTEPTGTSDWHKAPVLDGYVYYQNTLADVNTVTAAEDLTDNKVILGAGSKGIKVSAYNIGAESYTAPATFGGANLLATEAAVKEYVDDVAGGVTSGLQLTYTDGTKDNDGKKVIKLTDTNNSALSFELDATPFIKDGMLESVQILKYNLIQLQDNTITGIWRTLDGTEVSDLISAPIKPDDTSIWMYFVWKTVHHDPNNTDTVLEEKTVSWLPATDLIKDCSANTEKGIDSNRNEDGGHKFYVKTTEDGTLTNANVSTGFDADGNVVGYVDLSAYQKSADLVAFDKDDMDAIFAAAEADLTANKGIPAFPTVDPLPAE